MGYSSYVPPEERKVLFIKKAIERGNFENIEFVEEFLNVTIKTKFLCKTCGSIFDVRPSRFLLKRCCPKCDCSHYKRKKLSIEEFITNVKNRGSSPDIKVLEFNGTDKPCSVYCKNCGSTFNVKRAVSLYRNNCCKTCMSKKMSEFRTNPKEHFLEEMNKRGFAKDIILIGEYTNLRTPAKFRCLRCDTEFYCVPARMYRTRNCVTCDHKDRLLRNGKSKPIFETNKYMFDLLNNKEDGYRYAEYSGEKLEWKCKECGKVSIKCISDVKKGGFSCPYCSDSISFPNKLMRSILDALGVSYSPEATFPWCISSITNNKYRYDFYVKDYGCIVEMMGPHHKHEVINWENSLEEIIRRDKEKKSLAIEHGIKKYIEIDCEFSDIDYIWDKISKSEFCKAFDFLSLDKNLIKETSAKSIAVNCWKAWGEEASPTVLDLCNRFKLNKHTVIRYLTLGTELGHCNYNPHIEHRRSVSKKYGELKLYNIEGIEVESFYTVSEFCEKYNYIPKQISYWLLKYGEFLLPSNYVLKRR